MLKFVSMASNTIIMEVLDVFHSQSEYQTVQGCRSLDLNVMWFLWRRVTSDLCEGNMYFPYNWVMFKLLCSAVLVGEMVLKIRLKL